MQRRVLVVLGLAVLLAACTNPFPFGPGRLAVSLDGASVRALEHVTLFPEAAGSERAHTLRNVVELRVSSQTDIFKYFADWGRQLQVRCSVEGAPGPATYKGFALDPVPMSKESGPPSERGRYRYLIRAFVDLEADDTRYENGRPAGTIDLTQVQFEALSCHLLGVQKAPVLYPRSNDLMVSQAAFRAMLKQAERR